MRAFTQIAIMVTSPCEGSLDVHLRVILAQYPGPTEPVDKNETVGA